MAEAQAADDQPDSVEAVEIAVRIAGIDNLTPEYVNLVHVNADASAFQLVFSRLMQPVVTNDEDRERWRATPTIEATAIARLVVTPLVVQQLIDVLQTTLKQFQTQHREHEDAKREG